MNTKEYLKQYRDIEAAIRCLQEQIADLNAIATRTTAAQCTGSGGVSDRVGRGAGKIVDLQKELGGEIEKLAEVRREIVDKINRIENPKEREVLMRRYILGQKWEKIAEMMSIEVRWLHVLHGRALLKIQH